MSRIGGKDTKPELLIRQGLHAAGLRFRLHRRDLPGRPDLVFPARRTVIFVHGCFWHGHSCPMCKLPATRTDFWQNKISGNRARDARTVGALMATGWRVLLVWECALRGPARITTSEVIASCKFFIQNDSRETKELSGRWQTKSNDWVPPPPATTPGPAEIPPPIGIRNLDIS